MKTKLTNNIGLKILAVVAATVLWLVVVNLDDPVISRNFYPIPVEVVNGDAITGEGKIYEILDNSNSIVVAVTAPRTVIDDLSRDHFKATADMMDITFMDTVAIDVKATMYADKIISITPLTKNMKIAIEDLAKKQFSIDIETTGTPEQGYCLGDVTSNVNIVSVSGPVSVISKIVRAEVEIDTSGLSRDISTSAMIELYDLNDQIVESDMITCSVEQVHVDVEMLQTKDVYLSFSLSGAAADGYGMTGAVDSTPMTLTVAGKGAEFNNMTYISVPAEALPIDGARTNVETTINVKNYLPDGIQFADKSYTGDVAVTVYVAPLETKEVSIPTTNITFTNIPKGYETILTDIGGFLATRVRGLGDNYNAFDGSTAMGVIDVASVLPEDADVSDPNVTLTDLYTGRVEFTFPEGVSESEAKSMSFILRKTGEDVTENDFIENETTGE